jgi:hypothetical protein
VLRQRRITAWTFHHVATITAQNKGGIAATVEEQDRLLASRQHILERLLQGPTKDV